MLSPLEKGVYSKAERQQWLWPNDKEQELSLIIIQAGKEGALFSLHPERNMVQMNRLGRIVGETAWNQEGLQSILTNAS